MYRKVKSLVLVFGSIVFAMTLSNGAICQHKDDRGYLVVYRYNARTLQCVDDDKLPATSQ